MKQVIFLLCLFLVGACKNYKKIAKKNEESVVKNIPQQVFFLEKTSCYGTCPSYKVVVFDNDSLVYEGNRHVAKEGLMIKQLPKGAVSQLAEKFRRADFFGFQNQYTSKMTDFPVTYIAFTDNGLTKKIKDYYKAPESLRQLEILISDLVKNEVGVNSN